MRFSPQEAVTATTILNRSSSTSWPSPKSGKSRRRSQRLVPRVVQTRRSFDQDESDLADVRTLPVGTGPRSQHLVPQPRRPPHAHPHGQRGPVQEMRLRQTQNTTVREGNTATRHTGGRDFRLARLLVLSTLARIRKYGRRFLSGNSGRHREAAPLLCVTMGMGATKAGTLGQQQWNLIGA